MLWVSDLFSGLRISGEILMSHKISNKHVAVVDVAVVVNGFSF